MKVLKKSELHLSDDSSLNFVSREGDALSQPRVGGLGLIGFGVSLAICLSCPVSVFSAVLITLAVTAFPMVWAEIFMNRVYLRKSSGLSAATLVRKRNVWRCSRKLAGFMVTLSALFFVYWLLPEYQKAMYNPVKVVMALIMPLVFLFAWPYIFWVDRRQGHPEDIYYQLGGLILGKWREVRWVELKPHLLSWAIKGFFLPLMLSFLAQNLDRLLKNGLHLDTYAQFFVAGMNLIFALDVTFGAIGYFLTLRILDSQIREPDSSAFGWMFTLACYPPFLSVVAGSYHTVHGDYNWEDWLIGFPVLYVSWGFLILVCYTIYVWATVCFGCRFSNLTNRGIITYGPYRYVKHPAYISKCLSWWMLSLPFVAFATPSLCLQASLLLSIKCSFYWFRAQAEENLLMRDPAYQAYSAWIDQHGLWAHCKKLARVQSMFPRKGAE